jgi:hypothetical protein
LTLLCQQNTPRDLLMTRSPFVQEFYLLQAKYYTQRNILKRGRNQGHFSHAWQCILARLTTIWGFI